jgi:hypothetical protein
VKVFKLPCEGLMAGARKGYNGVATNGVYKNTIGSICFQVRVFDCLSRWAGESQNIGSICGDFDILSRQQVCF